MENVLLGETMLHRVEPVAQKINAAVFKPRSQYPARWMIHQIRWIRQQIRSGKVIFDIGIDAAWPTRSDYYAAEISMLREAGFTRIFRHWVTGTNGHRFRL